MSNNPISATIDFEKDGIQHGFLKLPHSTNESAWGSIMIPITQIKSGTGPTALLSGGNHGDEYEGPIALYNFAARDKHDDIQGRVIIVPAMNYPAFVEGTRVSPIDGLNMNRIYPGKAKSTVTNVIADYFSQTLVPMADYVLDIHSGGKTLDFVPFAACHELNDKEQEQKCTAAMHAFGAPYNLKMVEIDATGLYDTQVESMGKIFVTTELGGGGTTSPISNAIAKNGVDNFLKHAGILEGKVTPPLLNDNSFLSSKNDFGIYASRDGFSHLSEPVSLDMNGDDCFLFAEHKGVVEPFISLGDQVTKGQLIARIHDIERTAAPTHDYLAPRDGMVISRHFPSRVQMGDCINVIANVV